MSGLAVEFVLPVLLVLTALLILWVRDLPSAIILCGFFSLLCAALFFTLDAMDVALTEAVVGSGVSTVLFLRAPALARPDNAVRMRHLPALGVSLAVAVLLFYGSADLPDLGAASSPVHAYLSPLYLEGSREDFGIPNVVTAILAGYRGYDTLGELVVIFTAGIGVAALLGAVPRRRPD